MAYGGGRASGSRAGDQGFREIVPRCQPGPDFEACRRDLLYFDVPAGRTPSSIASQRP